MKLFTTKSMARTAYISALYATLTIVFAPASYFAVQFRISEALTILPLFMPESIVGLFIGCLIANIFGAGVYDIIFGSLTTLIAGILTFLIGRAIKNTHLRLLLGSLPPIILNAFVVPLILILSNLESAYWPFVLSVALGQAGVIILLGAPLYIFLKKVNFTTQLTPTKPQSQPKT